MLKKIVMLAVVPLETKYTAYFHCKDDNIILPLEISSESSFALISAQQKILFDCNNNFGTDPNIKIDLKVELFVEEWVLKDRGIRITKDLLEKSLIGLEVFFYVSVMFFQSICVVGDSLAIC